MYKTDAAKQTASDYQKYERKIAEEQQRTKKVQDTNEKLQEQLQMVDQQSKDHNMSEQTQADKMLEVQLTLSTLKERLMRSEQGRNNAVNIQTTLRKKLASVERDLQVSKTKYNNKKKPSPAKNQETRNWNVCNKIILANVPRRCKALPEAPSWTEHLCMVAKGKALPPYTRPVTSRGKRKENNKVSMERYDGKKDVDCIGFAAISAEADKKFPPSTPITKYLRLDGSSSFKNSAKRTNSSTRPAENAILKHVALLILLALIKVVLELPRMRQSISLFLNKLSFDTLSLKE
jgi:hypothetical protein